MLYGILLLFIKSTLRITQAATLSCMEFWGNFSLGEYPGESLEFQGGMSSSGYGRGIGKCPCMGMYREKSFFMNVRAKSFPRWICPRRGDFFTGGISRGELSRVYVCIHMQDYKSKRPTVMISAIMVNTHTHRERDSF